MRLSPQCKRILEHLQQGGSITTLQAMNHPFHCCRLSERIREIEKAGHLCNHKRITTSSGKHVMLYTLINTKQLVLEGV